MTASPYIAAQTKICTRCGDSKSLDAFHNLKRGVLGRAPHCKVCDSRRNATSEKRDSNAAWSKNNPDKRAELDRGYRTRHPEKVQARKAVHRALASGTLVKGPCIRCGSPVVEAHHPDHSRPLEVEWLCRLHHARGPQS